MILKEGSMKMGIKNRSTRHPIKSPPSPRSKEKSSYHITDDIQYAIATNLSKDESEERVEKAFVMAYGDHPTTRLLAIVLMARDDIEEIHHKLTINAHLVESDPLSKDIYLRARARLGRALDYMEALSFRLEDHL